MGNRAVITTEANYKMFKKNGSGVGIYVHWEGGLESIRAFANYCRLRGVRNIEQDETYAFARMVQIIGNYFSGNLSVGVGNLSDLDVVGNNGIWIINKQWKVCKNIWVGYGENGEDKINRVRYGLTKRQLEEHNQMIIDIDKHQPEYAQLGEDYLLGDELPALNFEVGDWVYPIANENWHYYYKAHGNVAFPFRYQIKGVGIDPDEKFNGSRTFGIPYYEDDMGEIRYMFDTTYRKASPPTFEEAELQRKIATNDWWGEEDTSDNDNPYPELGQYKYALTFNYSDESGMGEESASYLHKTEEDAIDEINRTFEDIAKELDESNLHIQHMITVSKSKNIHSLTVRFPTDSNYKPYLIATIAKIYC